MKCGILVVKVCIRLDNQNIYNNYQYPCHRIDKYHFTPFARITLFTIKACICSIIAFITRLFFCFAFTTSVFTPITLFKCSIIFTQGNAGFGRHCIEPFTSRHMLHEPGGVEHVSSVTHDPPLHLLHLVSDPSSHDRLSSLTQLPSTLHFCIHRNDYLP